nr:DUF362 domain-containing protein [Maliibacterium massiliense]
MTNDARKTVALMRLETYARADTARALDGALDLMGGISSMIAPGMRVLVKVNLLRKSAPEQAITTHPAVVEAVCRALQRAGATPIIGDSPGGRFTGAALKGVYESCGMAEVARRTGAQLNWDTATCDVQYPAGGVMRAFTIARMVTQADAVISLAKLKTHGMTGYTGAVKNLFGVIPGTVKVEHHYRFPTLDAFADMLLDIEGYVRPVLSVIDAVEAMEGEGPSSGDARHMGALVVSKSAHAADWVGISLMNQKPPRICTIQRAIARGLLAADGADIAVLGEPIDALVVRDFKVKLPKSTQMNTLGAIPPLLRGAAERLLRVKPQVDGGKCVGCAECARSCPVQAITMASGKAQMDLGKCIRCFCCQELCPRLAVSIHRPWIVKLLK